MSDTPRTDEAATRIGDGVWVSAEVARDLERELADLKARLASEAEAKKLADLIYEKGSYPDVVAGWLRSLLEGGPDAD